MKTWKSRSLLLGLITLFACSDDPEQSVMPLNNSETIDFKIQSTLSEENTYTPDFDYLHEYFYDAQGRISQVTLSDLLIREFFYNPQGQLEIIRYHESGAINWVLTDSITYRSDGRLDNIRRYDFDHWIFGTYYTTDFSYKPSGQIAGYELYLNQDSLGNSNEFINRVTYTWENGNIVKVAQGDLDNPSLVRSYTYDDKRNYMLNNPYINKNDALSAFSNSFNIVPYSMSQNNVIEVKEEKISFNFTGSFISTEVSNYFYEYEYNQFDLPISIIETHSNDPFTITTQITYEPSN